MKRNEIVAPSATPLLSQEGRIGLDVRARAPCEPLSSWKGGDARILPWKGRRPSRRQEHNLPGECTSASRSFLPRSLQRKERFCIVAPDPPTKPPFLTSPS